MNPISSFNLNSTNADFNQRKSNVFDQISELERNRNVHNRDKMHTEKDNKQNTQTRSQQRAVTESFRGKESIFKKPQHPVPRNYINRTPDFKKNPHKWTKYSLEDVEEITDESNKKSALSFLKELANRKALEGGLIKDSDKGFDELSSKIVFKRKTNISTKHDINEVDKYRNTDVLDKPTLRNFKVIMPEYVVGQKVRKDKKKVVKTEKGKELKLDHLYEDE